MALPLNINSSLPPNIDSTRDPVLVSELPVGQNMDDAVHPELDLDPMPSQNTGENDTDKALPDLEERPIDLPSHRFDDDIENDLEHTTPLLSLKDQTAVNDVPDDPTFSTPVNSRKPSANPLTPANVSAIKPAPSTAKDTGHDDENNRNSDKHTDEIDPTDSGYDMLSKLTRAPLSASKLLSDWLAQLAINGPASVASVLSLVIAIGRPVGALVRQQLITPEMIIANQPANNISGLSSILSTDPNARVPILAKDAQSKRVRKAYEDFWCRLPTDASNVVIFDTDCVETLISWLEPMVCSASRGLRTAACYAAYRMVDGFIAVKMRLQKDLASMQRQLSSERNRSGGSSTTPSKSSTRSKERPLSAKGKELVRKVEELSTNSSELSELCDRVFRSVFVLKYRDVSPDIRGISVKALGAWILALPRQFLDDVHLKYIGWLLYDKDANVRRGALEVVLSIVMKKDLFRNLNTFLGRFSGRIVEMCRDRDDAVALSAIKVLTILEPNDVLDQKSREIVCAIAVEETQVDIRRAAGEFFSHVIIRQTSSHQSPAPTSKKVVKSPGQKGRSAAVSKALEKLGEVPSLDVSREHITQLLFAVSRKNSEHAPVLAVDAVWDHLPALRCWDAFESFLIERAVPSSSNSHRSSRTSSRRSAGSPPTVTGSRVVLSDNDKVLLCEILLASATEASGNGDESRARLIAQSESVGVESLAQNFTRFMVLELPKILTHFQADGCVMKHLVQLPRLFRGPTLVQESFKPHLKSLLNRLVDALTRHSGETEVAHACSDTFRSLISDENPINAMTLQTLQLACKRATKEFSVAVLSGLADVEFETVRVSLVRLRVLSELVEPSVSILDPLLKLLRHQVEKGYNSGLADEVTCDTVRTMIGLVVWSLLRYRSRLNSLKLSESNLESFFETNDIQETQKQGAKIVSHILEMCTSDNVSLSTNTIALQGLLTTMTLTSGIEKHVVERLESDGASSECFSLEMKNRIDLLNLKARRDVLAEAVKQCILSLIENECSATKLHSRPRRRAKAAKEPDHSDILLKQCVAALVRASIESPISKEICHLPLLGLLLKGRRGRQENVESDVSIFNICRRYYELRIMRGSCVTEEEIRVLMDCGNFERKKEKSVVTSRDMAEVFVSCRRQDSEKNALSLHILRVLVDWVVNEDQDVENVVDGARMLCNVATGLLGYLTREGAQHARQRLKSLEEFLKKDWIVEECGEVEASVEGLVKALEAIHEFGPGYNFKAELTVNNNGSPRTDSDVENDENNVTSTGVPEEDGTHDEPIDSTASKSLVNTAVRRSSRKHSRVDFLSAPRGGNTEILETRTNNEEAMIESNGGNTNKEGIPERRSQNQANVELAVDETALNNLTAEVQDGSSGTTGDTNNQRVPLNIEERLFNDAIAEKSGQNVQSEKLNGNAGPRSLSKSKGRKRRGCTSNEVSGSNSLHDPSDLANKAPTRVKNSGRAGDVVATRTLATSMHDEEDTNSGSASKTLPTRRSKRRRSNERSQPVTNVALELNLSKRPRTPKGVSAHTSCERMENHVESGENVNGDGNHGHGIKTRSATKVSGEVLSEEIQATPNKPTVRRRKRYRW